jgi:hypothetical protein
METMNYCTANGIKGVIMSIDQTKAFDSVSHSYMEKVYEFFGFGPRIKAWLKAVGTGRTACIRTDKSCLANSFCLGKGHAQGDSPSPILYNLAAQIQIFKLEFDRGIDRIPPFARDHIENVHRPEPVVEKFEGKGETCINESFADDSSNLTVFNFRSLSRIKQILEQFKIKRAQL